MAARPFAASSRNRVSDFFSLYRTKDKGGNFAVHNSLAVETLQALSLFHLTLQSGSFLAMACAVHGKSILEEIVSEFDPLSATDGPAKFVKQYAAYLLEKLAFHNKYRIVEGNMSIGTYQMVSELSRARAGVSGFAMGQVNYDLHLINLETLRDGLLLLESCASLLACGLAAAGVQPNVAPNLIPVIKESFSEFTLLLFFARVHVMPFQQDPSVASRVVGKFNDVIALLNARYADVNGVPVIVQTMGAAPPPLALLDPSWGKWTVLAPPPSHSPFVAAYLQQQQLQFQMQQQQHQQLRQDAQSAESFFPDKFEADFGSGSSALLTRASAPAVTATTAAAAASGGSFANSFGNPPPVFSDRFEPPVVGAPAAAQPPKQSTTFPVPEPEPLEIQPPPPAISPTPRKDREDRLRTVGNRRGSVKDIAAMREKSQDNDMFSTLSKLPKEDLVAEVIFLRNRVAMLESQLAETSK